MNPLVKRRGTHVTTAVLDAAAKLIVEDGYDSVTVARISKLADVHPTSIYRRWQTLNNILAEAVYNIVEDDAPIPDTGDARTDLIQFCQTLRDFMGTAVGQSLARQAIEPVDSDDMAERRREFWQKRFTAAGTIIHRGIENGQIRRDIEPGRVLGLVTAPLHLEVLLDEAQEPVNIEANVDIIWRAIASSE